MYRISPNIGRRLKAKFLGKKMGVDQYLCYSLVTTSYDKKTVLVVSYMTKPLTKLTPTVTAFSFALLIPLFIHSHAYTKDKIIKYVMEKGAKLGYNSADHHRHVDSVLSSRRMTTDQNKDASAIC